MLKQFEGFAEKDLSGWVVPTDEHTKELMDSVRKHGISFSTSVNIITDAFQHAPKTIHYRGIRLIADKRGVRMIDKWQGGGLELRFRSLRTAKVFAKGLVYDEC